MILWLLIQTFQITDTRLSHLISVLCIPLSLPLFSMAFNFLITVWGHGYSWAAHTDKWVSVSVSLHFLFPSPEVHGFLFCPSILYMAVSSLSFWSHFRPSSLTTCSKLASHRSLFFFIDLITI